MKDDMPGARALKWSLALSAGLAGLLMASQGIAMGSKPAKVAAPACAPDNAGLTLPDGFCATVFADKLGQARQMAVGADGTLYVNTWLAPTNCAKSRSAN
jgi:hypothetical protein